MSDTKLEREHCVLLLIDVQEKLAAAMKASVTALAVRNINILLEAARRMGIPVVVSEQYPKGLGPTVSELRLGLDAIDDLSRIEKLDFSVCASDDFGPIESRMKESARDQWLVVGMETHICVFQTLRSLIASGSQVHLPVDAVVSRSKQNYQVGLGLAERCGAVLTSTEVIVMDLLGRASGDDFKAISKLIR